MRGRAELIRRAANRGVAVSYRDWRGREAEVSDETLAAVLAALGEDPAGGAAGNQVFGAGGPGGRRRAGGVTLAL